MRTDVADGYEDMAEKMVAMPPERTDRAPRRLLLVPNRVPISRVRSFTLNVKMTAYYGGSGVCAGVDSASCRLGYAAGDR